MTEGPSAPPDVPADVPPDPGAATTVTEFVETLRRLRRWAGEPSLSRLRSLAGQAETPDGGTVDRLPKSTVSHVLRQTDKLPRWDFVQAFVTACLRYRDHPAERIGDEVDRWRAARANLAGATVAPPPAEKDEPEHRATGLHKSKDQAAELLARRVAKEEDRARKGLLGGYSIAPVSFAQVRPDDNDDTVPGDLNSIGRFFSGLSTQRLLVVGESGAGKTVLAIELVLQLVERSELMVPVRLNAARWTLGRQFEPWLAEQLAHDFGLAGKDAARLVHDRRVLPVVDGLDELDPEPSTGPPRRAMGLLAELNRYSDPSGRRPGAVVVTCRADRYAELSAERVGLDSATVLRLHDLSIQQINAYLRARWPDGHPCGPHRGSISTALAGKSGTAVHAALATPWRLLLTVTAVESGADPDVLLHADPNADAEEQAARIAQRLLDAYIPAATGLTPAHRTPYRPEQVREWLVQLAAHLRWQAAYAARTGRPPNGMTAIDIVPHLLWPIGGRRLVRALHCLCCAALAVVAMLAFWVGSAVDRPRDVADGLGMAEGLTLALMAGWVVIATGLSLSPWPTAAGGRTNVPRRMRLIGGLLGASAGGAAGVLGGLAGLELTGGEVFGRGFAVVAGAAGGSALGAVIGLTAAGRRGSECVTGWETVRGERATLLGFGLCGALTGLPPLRLAGADPLPLAAGVAGAGALACALGVAFRIATGGWSKDAELAHPREALHRNPLIGVAFGLIGGIAAILVFTLNQDVLTSLACGVIGGVTFGLAFGAIAWCRTMIGLVAAAARGLLPLRLWTFLDWACEARLLRISGATYQFRHHELQRYLTPSDASAGHGHELPGR